MEPTQLEESQRDGNYFLQIVKSEQERMLALAAVGEAYTDTLSDIPGTSEETLGLLRSASGKARLLASQKMKQFEGLCHKNLNSSPEDKFPTTIDDLQGFWDMVYLQVAQIDSIFADIEQLRTNDWKRTKLPEAESLPKATRRTKSIALLSKSSLTIPSGNASANSLNAKTASSAAALKRDAQRKQLMEMKRQRRKAVAAANNNSAPDGIIEANNTIGDSTELC